MCSAVILRILLNGMICSRSASAPEAAPGGAAVAGPAGGAGRAAAGAGAPAGPAGDAADHPAEVRLPVAEGDDAAMVRINLRLPANLKALIEDAAAGGGLSVNAWIVRAAAAGLASEGRHPTRPVAAQKPGRIVGESHSGWAR